MGYGTVQYFNKEIDDDDEFSANVNKIPTAALPTQLQPDFLHGLHTAHHFLLVFRYLLLVHAACVGLNLSHILITWNRTLIN